MRGVDRATPPSDGEYATLHAQGVQWVGVYVGGINNGGRAWHPEHAARVRSEGFESLPIYVGQNGGADCRGCAPWNPTVDQANTDGDDAAVCAARYGYPSGPLALDLEYSSYMNDPAGAMQYVEAWAERVTARGYHPVIYMPLAMFHRWVPGVACSAWVADWVSGEPGADSPGSPAGHYVGVAWQWSDNWFGFDASTGGTWYGAALAPEVASVQAVQQTSQHFEQTDKYLQGGFYQYWSHNGGVNAFGLPTSGEYDTEDMAGKPVRRQWFERSIFEWRPGQWPDQWDTLPVLLAKLVQSDPASVQHFHDDAKSHADMF